MVLEKECLHWGQHAGLEITKCTSVFRSVGAAGINKCIYLQSAGLLAAPAVMERFLNSLAQQQQEEAGGSGRAAGGQAGASRQDLGWVASVLFVLLQSPLNSETASWGGKLVMRIRCAWLSIFVVIHIPYVPG